MNCSVTTETSDTHPRPCPEPAKFIMALNGELAAMCQDHAIRAAEQFDACFKLILN